MPLISIIVPVYNAEKYIGECIDSILAQTLIDFELILVDDGSLDKSGDICDKYVAKDSRLKVFHKKNGGVSSARNYGISQSSGQWICFVDSDDFIGPTHLSDYFENYKEGDNLLMCGHVCHSTDYKNVRTHTFSDSITKETNIEDILYESEIYNIINSPVCKLFKRDIVVTNEIRFDTRTDYGEDHLFVLEYCMHVTNISVTSKATYHYVFRGNISLTRRVTNSDRYVYYLDQLVVMYDRLCRKRKWEKLKNNIKYIISSHSVMAIVAVFNDKRSSNIRKENFRKIFSAVRHNKTFDVKYFFQKIIIIALCFPPSISYVLCKYYCLARNFMKNR